MARLFICREIMNQIEAAINWMEENIDLPDERSIKAPYIYSLFESPLTETL